MEFLSLMCTLTFECDLFITQWALEYVLKICFLTQVQLLTTQKTMRRRSQWEGNQFYLKAIPIDKGLWPPTFLLGDPGKQRASIGGEERAGRNKQ